MWHEKMTGVGDPVVLLDKNSDWSCSVPLTMIDTPPRDRPDRREFVLILPAVGEEAMSRH